MKSDRVEELLRELGRRKPLPPPWKAGEDAPFRRRLLRVRTRRQRWTRIAFASTAAAALLFLLVARLQSARPEFSLDTATEATALFATTRTPESGSRFFAGVEAERDVYVRLVAIDERGNAHPLAVGKSGEETLFLPARTRMPFGDYPIRWVADTGEERTLVSVLALLAPREIDSAELREALRENWSPTRRAESIDSLEKTLGCWAAATDVPVHED